MLVARSDPDADDMEPTTFAGHDALRAAADALLAVADDLDGRPIDALATVVALRGQVTTLMRDLHRHHAAE